MTSQTRQYIELSDIAGLRLECKNCGTSVSFRLEQRFDLAKLDLCPGCGKVLISAPPDPNVADDIRSALRALLQLRKAVGGQTTFQGELSLMLEIVGDTR